MATLQNVTNVTFDEIQLGTSASWTQAMTPTTVELLALVSGDVDPFHLQAEGAAGARPGAGTTQAAGAKALIATVLGRQLPGPGTKILKEDLQFHHAIQVGDQLTATITATEKRPAGAEVVFACRCTNQDGQELISGHVTVTAPTQRITYADVVPPQLALRRGDSFINLFKACAKLAPVTCAVVHPCERDALLGPLEAAQRRLLTPVLVGPEEKIRLLARQEGVDLSSYRLVNVPHSHAAAARAVELARSGEVEALMKGSLHNDELMDAVSLAATGLRTARRMSHVFLMDVPVYPRLLLVTDAVLHVYPKLAEKVDIVQNAIHLAHVLGIAQPKVAILSAVDIVNADIQGTVEAAALCKMADRGQIGGGVLDGPLAFDNAINAQAAQSRAIVSPVAGQADILLVPDLEAGNMLAQQLAFLVGAESAGVVMGARVPIALPSRADTLRSRLAATAVLVLLAHARRAGKLPLK